MSNTHSIMAKGVKRKMVQIPVSAHARLKKVAKRCRWSIGVTVDEASIILGQKHGIK